MSISKEEVLKVAHLGRLQISDDKVDEYTQTLSNILDFVAQMDSVDTTGIEPMAHPLDMVQRLRVDAVTETDQRELFQSIAPAAQDGLYIVPKVIE